MKKNLISLSVFAVICSVLLLIQGCGGGGGGSSSPAAGGGVTYTAATASDTYSGSTPAVYHKTTSGYVNLDYTLDLGSSAKTVYFVFTNTSTSSDSYSVPSVSSNSYSLSTVLSSLYSSDTNGSSFEDNFPRIITPAEVENFNRDAIGSFSKAKSSGLQNYSLSSSNNFYVAGTSTNTFYYTSKTSNTIPSTCRGVYSNTTTGVTLNIWVANDCWTSGGTKTVLVTQAMVDALGTLFMGTSGTSNIYSWITSIFGAPWGTTGYSNLISSTSASSIDILLCDTNTVVGNNTANGVVLGFFYSKDNFSASSITYSNARLMFYLDAISLASPGISSINTYNKTSTDTWSLTSSYWPVLALSTLGHEFQHMIHFYQRSVVRDVTSDTWLNEMCSMAGEDFIADKLGISAPSATRIPRYNAYDYYSLVDWNDSSPLPNYGLSYSFGAYLSRNFGGVSVFKKIVQSSYSDFKAVENAVAASSTETFSSLLQKWGAAVLLSDYTTAPSTYVYNSGSTFSSTLNSISYTCASINLFSFTQTPVIYSSSSASSMSAVKRCGNLFYQAGSSLTGTQKFKIKVDDGVKLTVVVK